MKKFLLSEVELRLDLKQPAFKLKKLLVLNSQQQPKPLLLVDDLLLPPITQLQLPFAVHHSSNLKITRDDSHDNDNRAKERDDPTTTTNSKIDRESRQDREERSRLEIYVMKRKGRFKKWCTCVRVREVVRK